MLHTVVYAKVKLPEIVGDNMVLQQNTQVKLWGTANPGEKIKLITSWNKKRYFTQADKKGKWFILVSTPAASYKTYRITISSETKTILNNILIGEVWFCSGQSNMQMPLKGFFNCPVKEANKTIALAGRYKNIRLATIPPTSAITPQSSCPGKWLECTPENAANFSAVAFYFAEMLTQALDVPVGVINCSWGGSRVEGWMKKEILETYPDIDLTQVGSKKINPANQPLIMYNGMLYPMTNYTVKGFLWYQGEANVWHHQTYAERLARMVELWREEWGLGELPFYYVEIAPYEYGKGDHAAYLREAQYKAQKLIPNSGMISTNDLVEESERTNVHPKNKKTVGERLCYMALADTYGYQNSIYSRGPEYKSMKIKDGKVYLSFLHVEEGFNRKDHIIGFEIAGMDKIFYPASAIVDLKSKQVVVFSEEVKEPVAVRYGFRNYLPGNLCNSRELPMVPFRTDYW
ncbi:sialate O-acetylesterase [Parabacteroides pacaensis]|uniref:sialate O-acetylesterase n=1 Tax=Parabacteroides pacaensis TaxID=2086575 RepID=UPI003742D2E7